MKICFLVVFVQILTTFCKQLLGVVDIFRHGARSPISIDKARQDIIGQKWNDKAELTSIGKRQLFLEGAQISLKYGVSINKIN